MSFAAAICSRFSEGIVPISVDFSLVYRQERWQIISVLNHARIPTYCFINSNAGSAGALIALATQHIYMSPASAIGAAAPVLITGEDLPATERDKTISYWSALIRSSAVKNGHNP